MLMLLGVIKLFKHLNVKTKQQSWLLRF